MRVIHFWVAGDKAACGSKSCRIKSTEVDEVQCIRCKKTNSYKAALPRPAYLYGKLND